MLVSLALVATVTLVASTGPAAQAAVPVGIPVLEHHGEADQLRNYAITHVDDIRTVVAESGWGHEESWSPPEALLEPGAQYDAYVLVDLETRPPEFKVPTIGPEVRAIDTLAGADPVVTSWTVAAGPDRFEVPSAQATAMSPGATNGVRVHLFPNYSQLLVSEDFDDLGYTPEDDAYVVRDPWWDVSIEERNGGYRWMHAARIPDFDVMKWNLSDEGIWTALVDVTVDAVMTGNAAVQWLLSYAWDALIWYGCQVTAGFASIFGAKSVDKYRKDCFKASGLEPTQHFDVTANVGLIDDGYHVTYNTSGAIQSAVETFVGADQMTGDGFLLDLTESNVGLFPMTSSYSAKALAYLEIDPDDVEVDADGKVAVQFGVQGPAGAQAWVDGVDRTDTTPGYRLQLGPDDGLATETGREAFVGSWSLNLADYDSIDHAKIARDYERATENMQDEINEALAEQVVEVLTEQPAAEPRVGPTVPLEPGVRYPLTLIGWSGFVPGELGLYADVGEGLEPVPMEWLTAPPEGTTGFNDAVFPSNEWTPSEDLYSMAVSADGSRLVELTEDGLQTSFAQWDGTWHTAEPFALERPLMTKTSEDAVGEEGFMPLSLDDRVAVNSDGTVIAAAFDQDDISPHPNGEVVIAETSSPWLPFDDSNASVTYLSKVLDQAGAEPFRPQDGMLFARSLAMDADGNHLAVSEVWRSHNTFPYWVDSTASSRLTVFENGPSGWQLQTDVSGHGVASFDGELRALADDGGHMWVATDASSVLHQLDIATMQVVGVVDVGIDVTAAAINGEYLIAFGRDGSMVLVDNHTLQISSTHAFAEVVDPAAALALANEVYVANGARDESDGVHAVVPPESTVRVEFPFDPGYERPPVMVPVDVTGGAVEVTADGSVELRSAQLVAQATHDDHGVSVRQVVKLTALAFDVDESGNVVDASVAGTWTSHRPNGGDKRGDVTHLEGRVADGEIHLDLYGAGATLHAQLILRDKEVGPLGVRIDLEQGAVVETYGPVGHHSMIVEESLFWWSEVTGSYLRTPTVELGPDGTVWFTSPTSTEVLRVRLEDGTTTTFDFPGAHGGVAGIAFDHERGWVYPVQEIARSANRNENGEWVHTTKIALEFRLEDGAELDWRSVSLQDRGVTRPRQVVFHPRHDIMYALDWHADSGTPEIVIGFGDGIANLQDLQPAAMSDGLGTDAVRYRLDSWLPDGDWTDAKLWTVGGYVLVAVTDGERTVVGSLAPTAAGFPDGEHQRFRLGANIDVFAGSVDVGTDADGTVRIATTTPYGVAVYRLENGLLHGDAAVYDASRSALTHTNSVALSDDGRVLFTSDPNYTTDDGRELSGALRTYRFDGDRWSPQHELAAPFDTTTQYGQAFGGKIMVNGPFLIVAGLTEPFEYAPLWMFRDVWGDWSELTMWNYIAAPGPLPPDPGSGAFVPTAGGRNWFTPTALIGHRPWDIYNAPLGHRQTSSLPIDTVREYRRFPLADNG